MSSPTRLLAFMSVLLLLLISVLVGSSLAAPALAVPVGQAGAYTISGQVFFDVDLDGQLDAGEPAVDSAAVSLRTSDGAPVQGPVYTSDLDGGVYQFAGVAPGSYKVFVELPATFVATTPVAQPVAVSGADVSAVNFGAYRQVSVRGRVYEDVDGSGSYNPGDVVIAGADARLYADLNRNGLVDIGEPLVASAVSDGSGFYVLRELVPGPRVLVIRLPLSGIASAPIPLDLAGHSVDDQDPLLLEPFAAGATAELLGTVWNDLDGDELIDPAEPGLPGVRLRIVDGEAGGLELSARAEVLTDQAGRYRVAGFSTALPYRIVVDETTVPAGWLPSRVDDANLHFKVPATVNIGYFDPLDVAPMRLSDWKKELQQAGKPRYTSAQLDGFIAAAENASAVFAETVGLRAALLKHSVSGQAGAALREHAALWLNLASSRLYLATKVSLPELTTATTVGEAVAEIEGVLKPDAPPATNATYERIRKLAQLLNKGQGLGGNTTGTFAVAAATYRGTSVVAKLRPGGDYVEMGRDYPVEIQKWSPGLLNTALNAFGAQARIRVRAFYEGGELVVEQKLPDGRWVNLGVATPTVWNKDVNATYTFALRGVSTAAELAAVELRLSVRDRDGGKAAYIRVDGAELVFTY